MHACMHACIQTYTHTYIHAYIHSRMHTYMHACMRAICYKQANRAATYNIQRHTYTHTCMHARMHAYKHTHTHTCMHANIHPYIHTYIHACIQTNKHTYIHIHTVHTRMHAPIQCIHTYIQASQLGHNKSTRPSQHHSFAVVDLSYLQCSRQRTSRQYRKELATRSAHKVRSPSKVPLGLQTQGPKGLLGPEAS